MEPRTLNYIAKSCQGELVQGAPLAEVCRVVSDSRQVQPGDLFVAVVGERFDGHDFIAQAEACGATGVLVTRGRLPKLSLKCAVICAADSRQALGLLAERYRREFALPVIAVAGSNGKTTTKELVAAVLRQRLRTIWSEASFNNDIGVPLTLLRLAGCHQAAVLEVGTNHPGELAPLVRRIGPTIGIVTSIGREHLEFFGSLEGVVEEEGSLAELIPPSGLLLVHGDSPGIARIISRAQAKVLRLGVGPGNDWQACNVAVDETGTRFEVRAPGAAWNGLYRLALFGKHQAVNALFAIAVGAHLGLSYDQIARGLAECQPPKMRLQMRSVRGYRILDDAYNANADSMLAALDTLSQLACQGRRVAVLGDMAELGDHAPAAHAEVGRHVVQAGVQSLFAVGKMASVLGAEARAAGLREVHEFPTVGAATDAVIAYLKPGDLVLLKASRSVRFEQMADRLE